MCLGGPKWSVCCDTREGREEERRREEVGRGKVWKGFKVNVVECEDRKERQIGKQELGETKWRKDERDDKRG